MQSATTIWVLIPLVLFQVSILIKQQKQITIAEIYRKYRNLPEYLLKPAWIQPKYRNQLDFEVRQTIAIDRSYQVAKDIVWTAHKSVIIYYECLKSFNGTMKSLRFCVRFSRCFVECDRLLVHWKLESQLYELYYVFH